MSTLENVFEIDDTELLRHQAILEGNLKHTRGTENPIVKASIELFQKERISLAKAAEIADYKLNDYISLLQTLNISYAHYTEEHLAQDIDALGVISKQK